MVSSVLGSVVLLAIAAYLTRWFFQWQRLSHIPGPTFAALSKFWLIRVGLKGRSAHAFKELQDRYGEVKSSMRGADLYFDFRRFSDTSGSE